MKLFYTVLAIIFSLSASAQSWIPTAVADMPMATSNNSVCGFSTDTADYMYSFGGIDTAKNYLGIHQKSFKYNSATDTWSVIDPLPDTLGKIAGAASYTKGKIYIIGGYHVYANGSELSSSRVHIYDPSTDSYQADGAPIPIPTDDHAQCVWRDSLIYVVGGWSNTGNIENVQIYNPTTDAWVVGTPLPNNNQYKFFGAQAAIRGDTIYYYGGAIMGANFPALPAMRIGVIDANNPLNINWLAVEFYSGRTLYRSVGITNPDNRITFLGGSRNTYNYNGLAYNGGLGVNPANDQVIYDPSNNQFSSDTSQDYPMDLRGLADATSTIKYICGGMENNQVVSKKAYKLTYMNTVGTSDIAKEIGLKVYPNPAKDYLLVDMDKSVGRLKYSIVKLNGTVLKKGFLNESKRRIELIAFSKGVYYLLLDVTGEKLAQKITIL